MTIKFNAQQLKNPTPATVSNIVAVSSVILGVFIGWLGTQNIIMPHWTAILSSISGLLLAILNGLKPFFGVQPTQDSVPIEKVTAMDDTADAPKKN